MKPRQQQHQHGSFDWRQLANLSRPRDQDALKLSVRRMAARGVPDADIATMLHLDPTQIAPLKQETNR